MQYQLLPDLTDEEFAALKADIAARGVMVPVELDETGAVLDGHHRVRACAELGITEYPRIIRPGMSEDEKREHVLALNLDRRHLTREQRRELVGRLRAQGWSLRRIADRLHVTDGTVRNDLSGAQNCAPAEAPATVTGSDGKQYPAKRPSVVVHTPKQAARALELLDGVPRAQGRDAAIQLPAVETGRRGGLSTCRDVGTRIVSAWARVPRRRAARTSRTGSPQALVLVPGTQTRTPW